VKKPVSMLITRNDARFSHTKGYTIAMKDAMVKEMSRLYSLFGGTFKLVVLGRENRNSPLSVMKHIQLAEDPK
jgi:hypothetical protein